MKNPLTRIKKDLFQVFLGLSAFFLCSLLSSYLPNYLAAVLLVFAAGGFGLSKSFMRFQDNLQSSWSFILPNILFWTNPLWLEDTAFTFPIWGPAPLIGWAFGVWLKSGLKSREQFLSWGFTALFLGFTTFSAIWVLPRWIYYSTNVDKPNGPESDNLLVLYLPESNSKVTAPHFAGKIQVFNFWSYSCGACIEEFPWWEEAKQQFAGDTTIQFNLVRWVSNPARDSAAFASDWQPDRNSTLTKYIISDSVARSMGLSAVPLVWVVDPAGKTLFWGGLPYWESGFKRKLNQILLSKNVPS